MRISPYSEKRSYDCPLPPSLPKWHDPATACVYRLYNDTDPGPFYIGSAYDPRKRLADHRRRRAWWWRVHHFTLEWYPDRATADLAEHTAIYNERPSLNQAGRTRVYMPMPHPRPAPMNLGTHHFVYGRPCNRCGAEWAAELDGRVCTGPPVEF